MADLIVENCRSWPSLTEGGTTDAIAIAEGRIVSLGTEARALRGPGVRVIDAGGAWALPGLVENHIHIFSGGATLRAIDCSQVMGREALAAAIRAADKARPGNFMLTGFGCKYQVIGAKNLTRHDLDAILPDRPLYLAAPDFHCAWANTAALRKAGILQGGDPGPGAEVVMGADGLATGELVEFGAMTLVKRHGPTGGREDMGLRGDMPYAEPSPAERAHDRQLIIDSLNWAARHGLTGVTSMDGNDWQAGLLRELAEADELPIRVSSPLVLTSRQGPEHVHMALPWGPGLQAEQGLGRRGDMLRFGRIKMFMDGVLDTHTALLVDPYADRDSRGKPLFPQDLFDAICIEADRLGLQIAVHCVGDGAVRAVLDGYEAARRANGARDSRHRIEHIELLHPDDLPRLKALGVTASMQPTHPPGLAGWPLEPMISIIGRERWPCAYPWRRIHEAGVPLVLSTDWPVSPIDPLDAIHCALSRQPWGPGVMDQRLGLDQTLAAYTAGGARAEFAEGRRGRIQKGMQGDITLIAGDIAGLAEGRDAAQIAMTICDGRVVYAA